MQTPEVQYRKKLTTAPAAVESIRNGSILCIALGMGMPAGLGRAFADRVLRGDLKDLILYYQHSMKYAGETFARPEVLQLVDARNFFIGEPDRKVIDQGIADGRKYLSYIPCNFSQIPRALTEHVHVNTFLVTVSPMDARSGPLRAGQRRIHQRPPVQRLWGAIRFREGGGFLKRR